MNPPNVVGAGSTIVVGFRLQSSEDALRLLLLIEGLRELPDPVGLKTSNAPTFDSTGILSTSKVFTVVFAVDTTENPICPATDEIDEVSLATRIPSVLSSSIDQYKS